MSENSRYRQIVDQFRFNGEDNFIFACQAAIPIVLTRDLLYQLWNNFKLYRYEFDEAQTYKISHLAISDLILSPLCREVGHELYEIPRNIRTILLEDLSENLGEKRKYTIAAFLKEYAQLEQYFTSRKRLKNLHLLTALSILDPVEMERQVIEQVNLAKTDHEKLGILTLHQKLISTDLDSDLKTISSSVVTAGSDAHLSPILIPEENPEAQDIIKIKLPAALRSRVRRVKIKTPDIVETPNQKALELIQYCIAHNAVYLDLGRLGLTDKDFAEGSRLDQALRECDNLKTLILSNSCLDFHEDRKRSSYNEGKNNYFEKLPPAVASLTKLTDIRCNGDEELTWSINDITPLRRLANLQVIEASFNKIETMMGLDQLAELEYLFLANNNLIQLSGKDIPSKLSIADLRNNNIGSVVAMEEVYARSPNPLKLSKQPLNSRSFNCIAIAGNPLIDDVTDWPIESDLESTIPEGRTTVLDAPWLIIFISGEVLARNIKLVYRFTQHDKETQTSLQFLKSILEEAQKELNYKKWNANVASALFDLIIPATIRPNFSGLYNLVLCLDKITESLPWEHLGVTDLNRKVLPLSLCTKIVRQGQEDQFHARKFLAENTALIIGNPVRTQLADLRLAVQEAVSTAQLLEKSGLKTKLLISEPAAEIITTLYSGDYKLIHIAAHGFEDPVDPQKSGAVIGAKVYLTAADFAQLSSPPECIFLSCDYLGSTGMAQALLEVGTKAVIVYREYLDDNEAYDFTEIFYEGLTSGLTISEAMQQARRKYADPVAGKYAPVNYQLYGDPFYRLVNNDTSHRNQEEENLPTLVQESAKLVVALRFRTTEAKGILVEGAQLIEHSQDELLLLLNTHLFALEAGTEKQFCEEAIITFDTGDRSGMAFKLSEVVASYPSEFLDITVARFEPKSHELLRGILKDTRPFKLSREIPGERQKILYRYINGTFKTTELATFDDPFLRYRCPRNPGGAGSPIINDNGEVIGIHHAFNPTEKNDNRKDAIGIGEAIWTTAILMEIKKTLDARFVQHETPVQPGDFYKYDIYISYEYNTLTRQWLIDEFLPLMDRHLREQTASIPKIFFQSSEMTSKETPTETSKDALSHSKILLAIITPGYLRNAICLSEWLTFTERAKLSNAALAVPIIFENGDYLKDSIIGHINWLDLSSFNYTKNPSRFDSEIFSLAVQLNSTFNMIPAFDPTWPLFDISLAAEIINASDNKHFLHQNEELEKTGSPKHTIKLLVNASLELQPDVQELMDLIKTTNKKLTEQNIYIEITWWEPGLAATLERGSNSSYYKVLETCDFSIHLFGSEVTKHAEGECLKAWEYFKRTGQPIISVYFKRESKDFTITGRNATRLSDFKKQLNELQAEYVNYDRGEELIDLFLISLPNAIGKDGEFEFFPRRDQSQPAVHKPLARNKDDFYSEKEIRDLVATQNNQDSSEVVTGCLLIFKTHKQHTWLVTTMLHTYIILDDQQTRANNRLIQTHFEKIKTLPLETRNSSTAKGFKVVRFAAQETWWFFSQDLFPPDKNLQSQIQLLIKQ